MANVSGTSLDDTLVGTDENDVLRGRGGADLLSGRDGNDTATYTDSAGAVIIDLLSGTGHGSDAEGDRLVSIEIVHGSAFDDRLNGGQADDTLRGFDGDDILRGRGGADLLEGGAGEDMASYADAGTAIAVDLAAGTGNLGDAAGDRLISIEIVHGSSFDDWLNGGAGTDTLRGLGGNDILRGRGGADLLDGAAGNDTVSYSDSTAAVLVDLAAGMGSGGDADGDRLLSVEIVHGSSFGDLLIGGTASDVLRGFGGDDVLRGGGGGDRLEGGDGIDTVSYADAAGAVTIDLSNGHASGSDAAGDILVSIEKLVGSTFGDWLAGDTGDNVLDGGAGNDRLIARGGADHLDGGDGIDIVDYSGEAHAIIGGRTGISDRVTMELDILSAIEIIVGTDHDDLIWNVGFDGTNRVLSEIHGGGGDDFLMDGVDTAVDTIESEATLFDGGEGNDWIQYVSAGDGLMIDLSAGTGHGDIAESDRYQSIENVMISPRLVTNGMVTTARLTNDVVIGTDGANQIDGGGGADDIRGMAGDDYLIGRQGAARYDGGEGFDTVDYDVGHESASPGVDVDLATGRGVGGTAEGHVYVSIEAVIGTDADDILTGDGHDNQLTGGSGADQLNGGNGNDTAIYAGAGVTVDLASGLGSGGDAEGDVLTGLENLVGTAVADRLSGDTGENVLTGRQGNDLLEGRAGDDVLTGGSGADRLSGGAGIDTASYRGSSQGVQVDLMAGTATGGDAAGDVLSGIESLYGSDHDDLLSGDGNANLLTGAAGNDLLSGGNGDDVLTGGLGADRLVGGNGQDTVSYDASDAAVAVNLATGRANGGDAVGDTLISIETVSGSRFGDSLAGTSGADTLAGNGGDDRLTGSDGDDILIGSAGADIMSGGAGIDILMYDSSGRGVAVNLTTGYAAGGDAAGDVFGSIESLSGSAFADALTGNAASNLLFGQAGDDSLNGAAGDDTLIGGAGADRISGGSGIDRASYAASTAAVTVDLLTRRGTGSDAEGDVLTSIESLEGSAYGDHLSGDAGDNLLSGGSGDDVLSGGMGDDGLIGGAGADSFMGGAGTDTVYYEAAEVGVSINLGTGEVSGGEAAGDSFDNIENLNGSVFADRLTGNNGINMLSGGEGDDVLEGEAGDDTLTGGNGSDELIGGEGHDRAGYSASTAAVTVDLLTGRGSGGHATGDRLISIENVDGSGFGDRLSGDTGDNVLSGGDGDDVLEGGDGDDALVGGASADNLIGGQGNDTAFYDLSADAVIIDLETGTATGGDATGDTFSAIESLSGSRFADRLTGNTAENVLSGGDGDDILDGGEGDDALLGGEGRDQLIGGAGADRAIYAASSAAVSIDLATGTTAGGHAAGDVLTGIEGLVGSRFADLLSGDVGNNTLAGASGDDRLIGQAGDDQLTGGAGADRIEGGAGNDMTLYGGSNAGVTVDLGVGGIVTGGDATGDLLMDIEGVSGSAFNDWLIGNDADNVLLGAHGNDVFTGGDGADYIDGGEGLDTVNYGAETADLTIDLTSGIAQGGSAENDRLVSIELVLAGHGNDTITGAKGDAAERFHGGSGNDVLIGGGGSDQLTGNAGADIFLYRATGESTQAAMDHIRDFSQIQGDRIDLSAIDARSDIAGNQTFTFIGATTFSGTAGELRTVVDGADIGIMVDIDGDRDADMHILLTGFTGSLAAADFVL